MTEDDIGRSLIFVVTSPQHLLIERLEHAGIRPSAQRLAIAAYVLAHGPDVLANFGHSEWAARDALKVVKDCRFTEFCTVGPGATFFLVNGAAPTRVPFSVQGTTFDPQQLKARPVSGRWGVFESGGRMIFPATTKEEAEQLIRVVQAYQFDQLCRVGLSPRASLKFLAKTGR